MRVVDRISEILGQIAAWALFAIGLMLGYEVIARYFFTAPTIWAEELSRMFMVWAVFLGAGVLMRGDEHIRVSVLTDLLGPEGRRAARIVSLLFVLGFGLAVAWWGAPIALDSLTRGRTTGSMLDIPAWWQQAAPVAGFLWLALQTLVELVRAITGPPPPTGARPVME